MTDVRKSTALVLAPEARDDVPPPELESFADTLYASLEPLAWQDDAQGWALALYCAAIGTMFQAVEDLARDTVEGPGWSGVMDLQRCPDDWLPWLAQFVGVVIPGGLSPEQAREWITSADGFARGTPDALRGAAAATLTGSKAVVLRERYPASAYQLQVITYEAETPDPALTARVLAAQKPAGIALDYQTQPGADYQSWKSAYPTYTALRAAYPSYREARDTPPA